MWSQIVNNGVHIINVQLFGLNNEDESDDEEDEKMHDNIPQFEKKLSKQQMEYITLFIADWNGLKVEVSNRPKNYEQFKRKAHSWLNGRRATQYGNKL